MAVAGGALGLWTLATVRRRGVQAIRSEAPLALALVSVAVTLASAPIDNLWHVAFGRDAVIWSPPHVLGIAGNAGIATAVMVQLGRMHARWAQVLQPVAGAMLLAALSFLVVEYDTDVPQFDPVWYLPVLALVSSLALGIARAVVPGRFPATRVALLQLLFVGAVTLFLVSQGFDAPKIPLVAAAALTLDVLASRNARIGVQALAYAGVLYATYLPTLDLIGHGVRLNAADVLEGLPLAVIGAFVGLASTGTTRGRRTRPGLATGALAAVLWLGTTGIAMAHDPGQGDPAGTFDLSARLNRGALTFAAVRNGADCGRLRNGRIVARRAGLVKRAPLVRRGCRFSGVIHLPQTGRWFAYVDLDRDRRTLESWLPVKVGEGTTSFEKRHRFAYLADRKEATALKWAAGVLIYALVIAFLIAILKLVRGEARRGAALYAN